MVTHNQLQLFAIRAAFDHCPALHLTISPNCISFWFCIFFFLASVVYIYGFLHCHPSYPIRGDQQIVPSSPPTPPSSSHQMCILSPNHILFPQQNGLLMRLLGKDGAHAGDLRVLWRFGSESQAAAQRSLFPYILSIYWIQGPLRPPNDPRWCQWGMGIYLCVFFIYSLIFFVARFSFSVETLFFCFQMH